jgi:UDP-glucose 4-epimerase
MAILVTGGAGYIGSHTCLELLKCGEEVVVIDNLSNSCTEAISRVEKLSGKKIKFYEGDILDRPLLDKIFTENKIEIVIHFAALKAVGESVQIPLSYFKVNVGGTINLLQAMKDNGVRGFVFSSSATVYGDGVAPYKEDAPTGNVTNPYGRTKVFNEQILRDLYTSDNSFRIAILRYFNPIGAHPSGEIGEDPNGIPNNLLPYITQVAIGKLPELSVFGDDYDTPDGTCIRDYIHVCDLAVGHVKAVEYLRRNEGIDVFNLGTGKGYSVKQIIAAFEKASGKPLAYKFVPRRAGDAAICYAVVDKAKEKLGFTAKYGIEEMCAHAWNWQQKNPKGYKG